MNKYTVFNDPMVPPIIVVEAERMTVNEANGIVVLDSESKHEKTTVINSSAWSIITEEPLT
jgi:formylmethanofuran dehydrogenase subunit A